MASEPSDAIGLTPYKPRRRRDPAVVERAAAARRTGAHRQQGEVKLISGRWKIRLREERGADGKRRQRWHDIGPGSAFTSKAAASRAAEQLRNSIAPVHLNAGAVMPWPDACRLYEQRDLAELSPGTQRNYRRLIRQFLEPEFAARNAHEITTKVVQEFIWDYAKTRRENKSAIRAGKLRISPLQPMVSLLLTMLDRLAAHGVAVSMPDKKQLKFPREDKVERSLPSRSFTVAQMDQLIGATTCARDRALLGLLRYLALRISEAVGLTLGCMRLETEQPSIDILQAAPCGVLGPTKTGRSKRTLPVPPELVVLLQAWLAELPSTPEGFLFPGRKSGHAWHPSAIRRYVMRPLVQQLGLPALSFHGLRHGASYAIVGSGNLADASRVLGHKDAKMTSAYAEATVAGMRQSVLGAARQRDAQMGAKVTKPRKRQRRTRVQREPTEGLIR